VSKTKKKSQRRPNVPVRQPAGSVAGTTRSASTVASGGREFNPDYTYVKQDLRRIGLLAGSLIIALIILSFVLR
jgi:hypothetical protein